MEIIKGVNKMGLASQKFYNAADGCWYEITPTLQNDKWITVHPNGEGTKGTHLLVKDGETPGQAVERKFGNKQGELFSKDTDLGKTEYKHKNVEKDDPEETKKKKAADKKRADAYHELMKDDEWIRKTQSHYRKYGVYR